MLPFRIQEYQQGYFELPGLDLKIPKYGCCTVGEVRRIQQGLSNKEAALMLLQRADPALTEADLDPLPHNAILQLVAFFSEEIGPPKGGEETGKKPPTGD